MTWQRPRWPEPSLALRQIGPLAKWSSLIGAWGAVFSSLLGVWQSVPYLFSDFWRLWGNQRIAADNAPSEIPAVDTRGWVYRGHLAAMTVIPITGLIFFNFSTAMKINGIVGALFLPLLALALLILCGRPRFIGAGNQNSWLTNAMLWLTLAIFIVAGVWQISGAAG